MLKCKYRNCKNEVTEGRLDKEYCCIKCKRNEKKYRQRERKKYEKINTR
jgi:hypothetical protein